MKNASFNLLLLIGVVSLLAQEISAYTLTDSHNQTSWTTEGSNIIPSRGVRFVANKNIALWNITTQVSCTATKCMVLDSGSHSIEVGSITNNICQLSGNTTFNREEEFFIVVNNSGSFYVSVFIPDARFPYNGTNINYTAKWYPSKINETDKLYNIENITTSTLPNPEILSLTLSPLPANNSEDISVSGKAFDEDGDIILYNETLWYKNGVLNSSWTNFSVIQNSHGNNLTDGDTIIVSMRVYDGYWSDWFNSSALTIADNTPPTLKNCTLQYSTLTDASGNTNILTCLVSDASSNINYIKFNLWTPTANLSRTLALNGTGKYVEGTYTIFQSTETLVVGSYSITNVSFADTSGNKDLNNTSGYNFTVTPSPSTPPTIGGGGGSLTGGECGIELYRPKSGSPIIMFAQSGTMTTPVEFQIRNNGDDAGVYYYEVTKNDYLAENCVFGKTQETIDADITETNTISCTVDTEPQSGYITISACGKVANYQLQVAESRWLAWFYALISGDNIRIGNVEVSSIFLVSALIVGVVMSVAFIAWLVRLAL